VTVEPLGPGGELVLEPGAGVGRGRARGGTGGRRRLVRWSDRKLVAALAAAMVVAVAGSAWYAVTRDTATPAGQGLPADHPVVTNLDGRDLSQVPNAEMEGVVEAHPEVVPMRLALVERYLDAAAKETTDDARRLQLEKAAFHAEEAERRATAPADHARAVRDLGWAVAHLGDPATGVGLLRQSLQEEPGNPDALWFLAVVQFRVLAQPADAAVTLGELIASPSATDAQRRRAQTELAQVTNAT
jgi:hypothetical protein